MKPSLRAMNERGRKTVFFLLCLPCCAEAFCSGLTKNMYNVHFPTIPRQKLARGSTVSDESSISIFTTTKKPRKNGKYTSQRKRRSHASPNNFLRDNMLNHEILTKEEEAVLGEKLLRGRKVRENIELYLAEKECQFELDREDDLLIEQLTDLPYVKESRARAAEHNDTFDDCKLLTDDEIINKIKILGGRDELLQIFCDEAAARHTMLRCNLKLVVSISRTWMRRNISPTSSSSVSSVASVYNSGDWDTPSLDEVIQEGVLGLSKAVDKFDVSKGYRFSTYATNWITSYVRLIFRNAATGCLRVPAALHEIKSSYGAITKKAYESGEALPTEEEAAKEIGVTVNRLRTSLRATQALVSIDAPMYSGSNGKGSAAGGGSMADNNLLISDTLHSEEPRPEHVVELSFLRQCLENAMASELSPHERDVIRLRLGLDDGNTRTIREVVEVCGGSISISDVRSAERRAYKKLRSPNAMHTHNLLAFLDEADYDLSIFYR